MNPKRKKIYGVNYTVVDITEYAGRGAQVVDRYTLLRDGKLYSYDECWDRPILGPHTLAWRGAVKPLE